jgi:hypothetical protein
MACMEDVDKRTFKAWKLLLGDLPKDWEEYETQVPFLMKLR